MHDVHPHRGDAATTDVVLADRYQLIRRIARGGMAEVFEAHDALLDRSVAVKLFRGAGPTDRQRFDAEVRLLAGLNHPGLVAVYDAGEHDGDGFMVLELVPGPTLHDVLAAHGARPTGDVARIGSVLAQALAHVHERGIVHRDLTPSNILIAADGSPRLTDFGIARLIDTTRITADHLTVGTAGYMAPEQVEGREVTPAADVYALGLVLLEALSGRRAFTGPSHEAAIARLSRDPEVPAGLPEPWPDLLRSMTARAPSQRPTAVAVSAALIRTSPDLDLFAPVPGGEDRSAAAPPIVVPWGGIEHADPARATAALPVSETGPPVGGEGGRPEPTSVMPAALLPPSAADPPVEPAGAAAAAAGPPPPPRRTRDGVDHPAPLSAAAVATSRALAHAGATVVERVRAVTPAQWVLVAGALAFALAAWGSGSGTWQEDLAAVRAAASAEATDPPQGAPTTVEPTSTTVAPAPLPVADDDPDEGKEGKGKGEGEKGKGEEGKGEEGKGEEGKGEEGDDD